MNLHLSAWNIFRLIFVTGIKMKKRLIVIALLMLILSGCAGRPMTVLPNNPMKFIQFKVSNPRNNQDGYMAKNYNGRCYVPYGTLKTKIGKNDIDRCVGYIYDNSGDTNNHVCTLVADPNNDFLVTVYEGGFMEQPMFLRAEDTYGQTVNIPGYIDDLGYDYWK